VRFNLIWFLHGDSPFSWLRKLLSAYQGCERRVATFYDLPGIPYSGVRHIERALRRFAARSRVVLAVGVDCQGSSLEGLSALLDALSGRGEIWVFHNEGDSTFHPKLYLFRSFTAAEVVVGSGNLTSGGLFTNYEVSLALSLEVAGAQDAQLLHSIEHALAAWATESQGTARRLDTRLLEELARQHYVVIESQQPTEPDPETPRPRIVARRQVPPLFARVSVQAAPGIRGGRRRPAPPLEVVPAAARAAVQGFVMTLQQTDAGYGQTSEGSTRRSPEVFIPLAARDYSPSFWGWQDQFTEDRSRAGKWDRKAVRIRVGTQIAEVNMMFWPVKHDFRLRSEALRSAGNVGDILRLEKAEEPVDYEYYAEIIPRRSSDYGYYKSLCTEAVRNSDKRWGYYL